MEMGSSGGRARREEHEKECRDSALCGSGSERVRDEVYHSAVSRRAESLTPCSASFNSSPSKGGGDFSSSTGRGRDGEEGDDMRMMWRERKASKESQLYTIVHSSAEK